MVDYLSLSVLWWTMVETHRTAELTTSWKVGRETGWGQSQCLLQCPWGPGFLSLGPNLKGLFLLIAPSPQRPLGNTQNLDTNLPTSDACTWSYVQADSARDLPTGVSQVMWTDALSCPCRWWQLYQSWRVYWAVPRSSHTTPGLLPYSHILEPIQFGATSSPAFCFP